MKTIVTLLIALGVVLTGWRAEACCGSASVAVRQSVAAPAVITERVRVRERISVAPMIAVQPAFVQAVAVQPMIVAQPVCVPQIIMQQVVQPQAVVVPQAVAVPAVETELAIRLRHQRQHLLLERLRSRCVSSTVVVGSAVAFAQPCALVPQAASCDATGRMEPGVGSNALPPLTSPPAPPNPK